MTRVVRLDRSGPVNGRRVGRSPGVDPTERGCEKGGFAEKQRKPVGRLHRQGLDLVKLQQKTIRCHVETIQEVAATLDPAAKTSAQRQSYFDAIFARLDGDSDPIRRQMAVSMQSFRVGLFAGDDTFDQLHDNLALELLVPLAQGHERRIHGHRHGVRIVQEGPTLVHAGRLHHTHPEPFGVDDLLPQLLRPGNLHANVR